MFTLSQTLDHVREQRLKPAKQCAIRTVTDTKPYDGRTITTQEPKLREVLVFGDDDPVMVLRIRPDGVIASTDESDICYMFAGLARILENVREGRRKLGVNQERH